MHPKRSINLHRINMIYKVAFWVTIVVGFIIIAALIMQGKHNRAVKMTIQESPHIDELLRLLHVDANSIDDIDMVGVIVEPREHHNLIPVLKNFQEVFPTKTVFVFHGTNNEEMILRAMTDGTIQSEKIVMMPLNLPQLTIRQYNYLLTHAQFYEKLPGDFLLIFQTDSILFTNSKVNIQDFMHYDYVGAPWNVLNRIKRNMDSALQFNSISRHNESGNGGLSLRRRNTMLETVKKLPYLSIPHIPEDVYFSNALHEMGASIPTDEEAAKLFFERVETGELPLGAHKHLPKNNADLITEEERKIVESY